MRYFALMSQRESDPYLHPHRVLETRFCERCQCDREFSKRAVGHTWHLAGTVVTLGLWGMVWLTVAIASWRRPWRCTVCRSRFVPSAKRHPQLGQPTQAKSKLSIAPRETGQSSHAK